MTKDEPSSLSRGYVVFSVRSVVFLGVAGRGPGRSAGEYGKPQPTVDQQITCITVIGGPFVQFVGVSLFFFRLSLGWLFVSFVWLLVAF